MKIWFTLTGTNHYYGRDFLEKGMKIRLEKEPDNKHDHEAIKVLLDGVGHIGYVANSPYTVIGESFSAGRLYDRIGDLLGLLCLAASLAAATAAFPRRRCGGFSARSTGKPSRG